MMQGLMTLIYILQKLVTPDSIFVYDLCGLSIQVTCLFLIELFGSVFELGKLFI